MKNKLYQMFILGTYGGYYKQALQNGLGGIIFFTHDIQNIKQFKALVSDCKTSATIPPFLAIDQEGGRVERTENIHNGKKYLSAKFARLKGLDFLAEQTEKIAKELTSYGLNLNFAPCIDVNTNPNNPIIGERAFSDKTEEVIECGKIVSKRYRQNNIIPCLKHYPGHGDASADSHLSLPKIDLSLEEMRKIHIKPFDELAKYVDMIMVAHLYCTCFENKVLPTSLSKNAISYLRENIGFEGVIISDDMVMGGVAKFADATERGIKAGVNMFIYRNSTKEIIDMIDKLAEKSLTDMELAENIDKSYAKIMNLKRKFFGDKYAIKK